MEHKLFFGFGMLTIISGIFLMFEANYIMGLSGSIVGGWLAFDNFKKIKKAE